MELKNKLSEVMKTKKISQYRLWKLTGISQSSLSDILNGITLNPSKETLEKIAKALEITVSELIGEIPTTDYTEENTDNPDTIVEVINNRVKIAVHKDHLGEYTEEDLKLAFEIIDLIKKKKTN